MIDIESTLNDVCDRLLSGQDLPEDDLNGLQGKENRGANTAKQKQPGTQTGGGAVKFSLVGFEKGIERFLGPRREHREGKRVVKRRDVIHARATGLRRFGKILMAIGKENATLNSSTTMVFGEDGGAEVHSRPSDASG